MRMKQKKNFWWKKFKMADFSKWPFFKIANSRNFYAKILQIGPWVTTIIRCKGHWCSSIYMVVRLSDIRQKQTKNAFFVFLGCFCPYVRQPHDHIGWATLMGFASINPTNPRTDLWNFREKISRIGDFEKRPFWKIGHFEFFSSKKNFFFASFLWKSVQICMVEWMSRNFDVFPGFQQIPCYE